MDISGLRNEIETDPLGRGYAGMTNEQIAADLNTTYRTRLKPLGMSDLLLWAGQHDILLKLDNNKDTQGIAGVVRVAQAILSTGIAVDLNHAGTTSLLDALVGAGVFTVDDKTALVALATEHLSRADELRLGGVVIPGHVTEALANG